MPDYGLLESYSIIMHRTRSMPMELIRYFVEKKLHTMLVRDYMERPEVFEQILEEAAFRAPQPAFFMLITNIASYVAAKYEHGVYDEIYTIAIHEPYGPRPAISTNAEEAQPYLRVSGLKLIPYLDIARRVVMLSRSGSGFLIFCVDRDDLPGPNHISMLDALSAKVYHVAMREKIAPLWVKKIRANDAVGILKALERFAERMVIGICRRILSFLDTTHSGILEKERVTLEELVGGVMRLLIGGMGIEHMFVGSITRLYYCSLLEMMGFLSSTQSLRASLEGHCLYKPFHEAP